MASNPITSWQKDREKAETVTSTGAPILLSVPWEQTKSSVGHPVCSRLGVSEAKVWY